MKFVLLYFWLASLGLAVTLNKKCDTDSDCPEPFVCRLLCKNTCNTMCIDLTFARRKPLRLRPPLPINTESEPTIFRDPPAFEPNPPAPTQPPTSLNNVPFNEHVQPKAPIGPPIWNPDPRISEHFSVKNCPPPEVCRPNCGIYIDEFGCQGCQCLWISQVCNNDYDCVNEGQYCDLGRCECGRGYRQHPRQSGVCQRVGAGVYRDEILPDDKLIRRKRSIPKKRHDDRLQWPGPCDNDSQCPSNLYCINYDCWHIPEKPLRAFQDSVKSEISTTTDDDKILTSQVQIPEDSVKPSERHIAILIPPSDNRNNLNTPNIEIRPPSILPQDVHPEFTTPKSVRPVLYTEDEMDQEVTKIDDGSISFGSTPSTLDSNPFTMTEDIVRYAVSDEFDSFSKKDTVTFGIDEDTITLSIATPRRQKDVTVVDTEVKSTTKRSKHKKSNKIRRDDGNLSVDDKNVDVEVTEVRRTTEKTDTSTLPDILDVPLKVSMTKIDKVEGDPTRIFIDYSKTNRYKRPVRVEMDNVNGNIRDECTTSRDCGQRYKCCQKRWCDLSKQCGIGRFCLPDCQLTKMMHPQGQRQNQIDLVYD
ncbi:unnamed protein product [Bursaphelenchus okinawaensis]|uniref:EB domain-containing protein n=1 Tax=Bursaphelenchus okinawaensis TaxID=465554 RepID=A0A811LP45_9BILA|nr:unnamed protein product [Bursaphelenchus okinawaensis]CAG9125299.1 unnamed protein product [Bursaphelenchus okinawaensis]